ncbi:hypothetical protein NG752_10320 [Aliarcobacter cryaerophilus]|uniref:hypothetical protein n=1 Tax=Aliarcobacter cryaerophilus TaxID=28198 RepID=UPI003DA2E37E
MNITKIIDSNDVSLKIKLSKSELAFYAIFLFTILNGFYNALNVAYGFNSYPYNTFVFDSSDLHADLVKYTLSFFQDKFPNYKEWSSLYQEYYLHNPYGGVQNLNNGQLSSYGSFPLSIVINLIIGQLIYIGGPKLLVKSLYIFVILSSFIVIYFFTNKDKYNTLVLLIAFLLSYTVLFMLTRGHIYSYLVFLMFTVFVYFLIYKKNIVIPILLLALIMNFRPNMGIFMFLFYIYGFRNFIKASFTVLLFAGIIFYLSLQISTIFLEGYSFDNIAKGLKIYTENYILGSGGDAFNNSFFGILKFFQLVLNSKDIQIISLSIILIFLPITIYLYSKKKIMEYDFIYLIVGIYILITPSFATYHMLILYIFILVPLKKNIINNANYSNIIICSVIVLLLPKNYYYNLNQISIETLINPIVILWSLFIIVFLSLKNKGIKI